ncbi:MAG: carboxymuconolactone decarboxylase family protein [Eggerthellaceae bacterium]|nr:carboxymuconolactone decarboxylase family protein [Eggerthellaceae bacterium]
MKKQTAGRDNLGDLAPKFAELNDDVLFGEVWSREAELSPRDRSLITISALFSAGLYPQLKAHLAIGKDHGLTKLEVVEVVTQLAFYCGWPKAWSTFPLIQEVYSEEEDEEGGLACVPSNLSAFPVGQPNVDFAQYFIGQSYLAPLSTEQVPVFNVTFEPGCRNNWHIHHAEKGGGQVLVCVYGRGWYQEWGKEARELHPGDVVSIPPDVKHWHGATADSWFQHLAIEVPGEGSSNEWLEPVDDEQYVKLEGRE